MTITYTADVATSTFSCFLKLLARWRGSIYKLLWKDFAVFAILYFFLSFLYRFVLNEQQRKVFEMISRYCASNNSLIPVAFVLGFYVALIMTRYWNALGHIPWPDHMAMYVTANVQGLDERSRMMRRTMLRYLCLAYTMTMAAISTTVKKRFPTNEHLIDAGLLTSNEAKSLEKIKTPHNKFFIPLAWTTRMVCRARKERRIEDEFAVKTLIDEINEFRMHLATLFVYDWIPVPLVYTQVVTVAVYMFFLACLMGRQFLSDDPEVPDMYFPIFTFLEYFFYMGWLKVAESLVNPFGEDEEDFDVNFLIDRNLQVSYIIVDEVYNEPPDLVRDQYWNDTHFDMPYTAETVPFRKPPHLGSAVDIRSTKDLEMSGPGREEMDTIQEADSADELDDDDGPGSPRPLHSFFQSPITVGGNVIRRLFSRQDSRTYGSYTRAGTTVPTIQRQDSPSTSRAASPEGDAHQPADELQFHMDEENPEANADENLLIGKSDRKSSDAIPMRRIRSATPRNSRDLSHLSPARASPSYTKQTPPQSLRPLSTPIGEDKEEPALSSKSPSVPEIAGAEKAFELPAPLAASSAKDKVLTAQETDLPRTDSVFAEPSSPTSPSTASSIWVLAASRFDLEPSELDLTIKEQKM